MTICIKRARIFGMPRIFQIYRPAPGKPLTSSPGTGRQHTVKHINTARHPADKIGRLANTHQITRLVRLHQRRCCLECLKHRLLPLADSQTANRIAFKANLGEACH